MPAKPLFYIDEGEIFQHRGLENEELVFHVWVRSQQVPGVEGFAKLSLELNVTSQYESREMSGRHVFGHRLITDGRLSWEKVTDAEGGIADIKGYTYQQILVRCLPLTERFGAARIKIVIVDRNVVDTEVRSDPLNYDPIVGDPNVEIIYRRVDNKPSFTPIPDIIIPKNGISKVVEFKLADEESATKDLNFEIVSSDEDIVKSSGVNYCRPILPIANGGIKEGLQYQVSGGKEIIYSTRVIRDGETFTGIKGFKRWESTYQSTGAEQVFELNGSTRAFQLVPEKDVVGTARLQLYVSDKLTMDYVGALDFIRVGEKDEWQGTHPEDTKIHCVKHMAGYFWVCYSDGGLMLSLADPYKEFNQWEWHHADVIGESAIRGDVMSITKGSLRDGTPVMVLVTRIHLVNSKYGLVYVSYDSGKWWKRIDKTEDQIVDGVLVEGKPFNELFDVCFGHGNGVDQNTARFVAVGEKGSIYSSMDGEHWKLEATMNLVGEKGRCILQSVKYAGGRYVTAGSDYLYRDELAQHALQPQYELIYACFDSWHSVTGSNLVEYTPVWKSINNARCLAMRNPGIASPEYRLRKITDIAYSENSGWAAVGEVEKLHYNGASYVYVEDKSATVVLTGDIDGEWEHHYVKRGRGNLLGIDEVGYMLAVGRNNTIVMFDTPEYFFSQWKSIEDAVETPFPDLYSVAIGDGIVMGVGEDVSCFTSLTPVRYGKQKFVATVTDWWETQDFLPKAIREHPLFEKTAELLDYLVANNHIQNMIKVDNLADGKSLHFDEEYFTKLLTDEMFSSLDLAQENKESLTLIAANMYNLKGTRRGLQYMLSFLSVNGQSLGAEVFDWQQVNRDPSMYGLPGPMEACSVYIRVKVPLGVYLSSATEDRIADIMRYFFWICLNATFSWVRTVRSVITGIEDRTEAAFTVKPSDSFGKGRPYDRFRFDGLEVFEDIYPWMNSDHFAPVSYETVLEDRVSYSASFLIGDGIEFEDSFQEQIRSWEDVIDFIDINQLKIDSWNPSRDSGFIDTTFSWVHDSFQWPEIEQAIEDVLAYEDEDIGADVIAGGVENGEFWENVDAITDNGILIDMGQDTFRDSGSAVDTLSAIDTVDQLVDVNTDLDRYLCVYINEGAEWSPDLSWGEFFYGEWTEFRVLSE